MTDSHDELLQIADRLDRLSERANDSSAAGPLTALENAAITIGRAWSGSWIGYHANVYCAGLQPPPPGSHFNAEWGLMNRYSNDTSGDWQEFDRDRLERKIYELADNPDLTAARQIAEQAHRAFDIAKPATISILTTSLSESQDPYLGRLQDEIETLTILSRADVIQQMRPKGSYMSRDSVAMHQGLWTPAHCSVLSEVASLRYPPMACGQLGKLARQAGSHLLRKNRHRQKSVTVGTNVFIGHGGSQAWRDLKDFISERLRLPWDEFNRVPVAGVTNIQRLSEMLESAAIAFLVMTGEDEQKDGKLHARMNVVHEAGLFQGRLGFSRAIVVLEDGCEEFSNIEGLGQIRFPKGRISSAFEEIRRVLERENLISPD